MALIDIVKKNYRENDNSLCFKTTPIAKVIIQLLPADFMILS